MTLVTEFSRLMTKSQDINPIIWLFWNEMIRLTKLHGIIEVPKFW